MWSKTRHEVSNRQINWVFGYSELIWTHACTFLIFYHCQLDHLSVGYCSQPKNDVIDQNYVGISNSTQAIAWGTFSLPKFRSEARLRNFQHHPRSNPFTFETVQFRDRPLSRPLTFETVHFRDRPFLRSSTSETVHFQDRPISWPFNFDTSFSLEILI